MTCALSRSGVDFTATKNSDVNLVIVGNNYFLEQVSVTTTDAAGTITTHDFSDKIDVTKTKVTVKVLQGRNNVVVILLPPPAPETLDIQEDCGGAVTKPLLSFGAGTHANANFKVIAS